MTDHGFTIHLSDNDRELLSALASMHNCPVADEAGQILHDGILRRFNPVEFERHCAAARLRDEGDGR